MQVAVSKNENYNLVQNTIKKAFTVLDIQEKNLALYHGYSLCNDVDKIYDELFDLQKIIANNTLLEKKSTIKNLQQKQAHNKQIISDIEILLNKTKETITNDIIQSYKHNREDCKPHNKTIIALQEATKELTIQQQAIQEIGEEKINAYNDNIKLYDELYDTIHSEIIKIKHIELVDSLENLVEFSRYFDVGFDLDSIIDIKYWLIQYQQIKNYLLPLYATTDEFCIKRNEKNYSFSGAVFEKLLNLTQYYYNPANKEKMKGVVSGLTNEVNPFSYYAIDKGIANYKNNSKYQWVTPKNLIEEIKAVQDKSDLVLANLNWLLQFN